MIYAVEDDRNIRELTLYSLAQSGIESEGFADDVTFRAACERRQRHRIERSVRLHNRGPQHDAAEAKRVQQPRRHVKPLARRFALHHVGQHEERQHHTHRRHRAHDDEHRAPAPEVDEEAGYGGPDGRREADDEAHQTHRTAVLAFGVH